MPRKVLLRNPDSYARTPVRYRGIWWRDVCSSSFREEFFSETQGSEGKKRAGAVRPRPFRRRHTQLSSLYHDYRFAEGALAFRRPCLVRLCCWKACLTCWAFKTKLFSKRLHRSSRHHCRHNECYRQHQKYSSHHLHHLLPSCFDHDT